MGPSALGAFADDLKQHETLTEKSNAIFLPESLNIRDIMMEKLSVIVSVNPAALARLGNLGQFATYTL